MKLIMEDKRKKRKDLARLPGMFINRDAGDVEANVQAFNHAAGNEVASEAGQAMGECVVKAESIKGTLNTENEEVKSGKKYKKYRFYRDYNILDDLNIAASANSPDMVDLPFANKPDAIRYARSNDYTSVARIDDDPDDPETIWFRHSRNESLGEGRQVIGENLNESVSIYDWVDQIEVNGPDYKGAPYPPRNRFKINEQDIPYNMRLKWFDVDRSDDFIELSWVTQEQFDNMDFEDFKKEVIRAIHDLAEANGQEKPFELIIKAECRDGAQYGYGEASVMIDVLNN